MRPIPSQLVALIAAWAAAAPALASEYCVACSAPQASYRCLTDDGNSGAGRDFRDGMLCVQQIARTSQHQSCAIDRQDTPPCDGEVRNVSTRDLSEPQGQVQEQGQGPASAATAPKSPTGTPQAAQPLPELVDKRGGAASQATPEPQPPADAQDAGDSKGTLEKTWDCMSSLFKKC